MNDKNRNPVKGKGERYIYCPQDRECVNHAAMKGWRAFNCEKCEIYRRSEARQEVIMKKKAAKKNRPKRKATSMENQKNQLSDLNDHLFSQMERLSSKNLGEKELLQEINRSKAVSCLATQIIGNARLALDATKAIKEGMLDAVPPMLGMKGYDE